MRPENPIGEPFFELSEVDSSNNYAMRQLQAHMAEHGTTWFAHYQNSGKGQRGKRWNAPASENIMMTTVLHTEAIAIENQFLLNVAISLACRDFFENYAIDKTCIKWPNDIYWSDRKAGGILIENVLQGKKWKYAVVGMGININQTFFPAEVKNAVSLKQITSKTYNIIALAKELCSLLENRWRQLCAGQGRELLTEYNLRLFKVNQQTTFKKDNAVFTAVVNGVNQQGELLIDTGEPARLTFGSVEWILP